MTFSVIILFSHCSLGFNFGNSLTDDTSRTIFFNTTGITGDQAAVLHQSETRSWMMMMVLTSPGLPAYNDWLTGVYEYIVKEYVEDVYVDIIETYVIATIKVAASRIKERE